MRSRHGPFSRSAALSGMTVVLNGSPVSLDGLLGYSKLQDLLTLIIGLLNDQGASLTQLQTDSDASRALVEKGLDEVREECKGHGSSLGGLASRMDELGGLASRMDELEKQAEQQKASQQELDKVRERLGAMEEQAKTLELAEASGPSRRRRRPTPEICRRGGALGRSRRWRT